MTAQITAFKETEEQMFNVFPNRIHRPVNKKENNSFPCVCPINLHSWRDFARVVCIDSRTPNKNNDVQEKCGVVNFPLQLRRNSSQETPPATQASVQWSLGMCHGKALAYK